VEEGSGMPWGFLVASAYCASVESARFSSPVEFRRERGGDELAAHSLAMNETPFSFTSERTLSRIIRAM